MKFPAFYAILFIIALVRVNNQDDKKNMLCQKWIQVSFKSNKEKQPHEINRSMAKECVFNTDGSYREAMYNNAFKASGSWFFNDDQTKMGFFIDEVNGQKFTGQVASKIANIVILKLNKDTLIYGNEAYYGKDKIYGHDDWYFVREK